MNPSRALSTIRIVFIILVLTIASSGTLAYFLFIQPEVHSSISSCIGDCYVLSFKQISLCAADTALGGDYFAPWSVTLMNASNNENITKVQPPGSPPSTRDTNLSGSPQNKQYALINFTLPNGNYRYAVNPVGFVVNRISPSPNTGAVTIAGHNAEVNVTFIPMSCGFLKSSNVTCAIQRVSVFSEMVISTSDGSTYTYGSTTVETYNVTTFTTNTSVTEQAGYESTTTLSASSTETITGAITAWTVQTCSWLP